MIEKTLANVQLLKKVEFFVEMSDDELVDIIARSSRREIKSKKFLFYQGDDAQAFFLVINGRVKLTQLDSEGDQVIHHFPGPGEAFGIIAVLREIKYPVTAEAVEDTQLLYWDKKSLRRLMKDHPQIAINSIRILSKFILDFQNRIVELSTERVEQRIARTLIRISNQTGKEEEKGIIIDIPLTRKDISEMCGTTLFTVSRVLKKWEKDGIIDGSENYIILKKIDKLIRIAEDH